jgi:phosphatidylserine decarboxylase
MIKLGSRTELVLPRDEYLEVLTQRGRKVKAGASAVARYRDPAPTV